MAGHETEAAAALPPGAPASPAKARLLVADDEESMRFFLGRALRRLGYDVETVASGTAMLDRLAARRFDIAVVDLKMPGLDGIEVLARIRDRDPEAVVLIMTAHGTIASAVEAMQRGAADYITKPFEIDEFVLVVERALEHRNLVRENRDLRRLIDSRTAHAGLIGQSAAMRSVFQTIDLLRDSAATVLISGESGTGKELVARAIHMQSRRAGGPFAALNCAAVPETLFEAELFGHEAGAFTGACRRKRGLVANADGGTLFLDEVAEVSLAGQAKLEGFLEAREFVPLGSSVPVRVDVRVIAATNRDLSQAVARGRFREELFWRLDVVPIHLPPLRERREDIPALVSHCLERSTAGRDTRLGGVTIDAMIALTSYRWPGNVRELQNVIERLAVLNRDKETLDVDDLPDEVWRGAGWRKSEADSAVSYQAALAAFERGYLENLFRKTGGNVSETARLAGISRGHLHRKIRQLDLDPVRFRAD